MKKVKTTTAKDKIKNSISSKLIMGWLISLLIPLLILFIILFVHNIFSIRSLLTEPNVKERRIWNTPLIMFDINREISTWASNSPSFNADGELLQILSEYDGSFPRELFMILEKKNNIVTKIYPLENDDYYTLEWKSEYSQYLSTFRKGGLEINEKLIKETGLAIYNQNNFYYDNGDEGIIYVLYKYRPTNLLMIIGRNLAIIVFALLVVHFIVTYIFIRTFTNPLNSLLEALQDYRKRDFTIRLDETLKDPMFSTINTAVNAMADDLYNNQAKNNLMEANRKEFLANISHDTKTPISSIRMHAEALRDGVIKDKNKQITYIDNIIKKTHSIDNMINELSLYSTLEHGIDQYYFSSIDINHYISDIVDEFKYDYRNDQLIINYNPTLYKGILLNLDANKFKRVFMNIIKNSVWYSGNETTIIDINLTILKDDVRISIKDNGQGIDQKNLNKIFESFVRGDYSRNPNQLGSGLGLAIAKTIVEGHGGTISAKSELNSYFEIVIVLPQEGGH